LSAKHTTFRIARFKPGVIDPPRFQEFTLPVTASMTVLDCLEKIRLTRDLTLMYRHSCHHSACGTCACIINGTERLACVTKISDLDHQPITVEPLKGFERLGDLVVRMDALFRDIPGDWTHLRPSETAEAPSSSDRPQPVQRFEDCIECGCCVSACPVARRRDEFMGPAALAALHREMLKSPGRKKDLLELAGGERGAGLCERALACSRVCPTRVYPARHIADLKKALASETEVQQTPK
jgi:succinate dehydrogenase / fumarate reductase iron-sulfur subunit